MGLIKSKHARVGLLTSDPVLTGSNPQLVSYVFYQLYQKFTLNLNRAPYPI